MASSSAVVVLLATYPCRIPKHGGQVRFAHMAQTYRDHGFEVHTLSVVDPAVHVAEEVARLDVRFPAEHPLREINGMKLPFTADLQSGKFAQSDEIVASILQSLPEKVDLVQVEQPYMLPLARKLISFLKEKGGQPVLIYSSYNVESPIKRALLARAGVDLKIRDEVVLEVDQLERAATMEADLAIAVTEEDAEVLAKNFGARKVVCAPNGVEPLIADPLLVEAWKLRLPEGRLLLYVASGYQPNIDGFFDQMGSVLGWLPPDTMVVLAGTAAAAIWHRAGSLRWGTLNQSKLHALNFISGSDLAAVSHLAHAHLVPISIGGGSNLKTAAAIQSGKWVVATAAGMRGYSGFSELPELRVAQTPAAFRRMVLEVLNLPVPQQHVADLPLRQSLQWSETLKPIMSAAMTLLGSANQKDVEVGS